MEVSDHIVILNQGKVEQEGSPEEVYHHPATPFVYRFIGQSVRLRGELTEGILRLGSAVLPAEGAPQSVDGYLRPHDLEITRTPGVGRFAAQVLRIQAAGPVARVLLQSQHDGQEVEAHLPLDAHQALDLQAGEQVYLRPRQLAIFPPQSDYVI
ncbi:MAG: TOBE-like domain-containing protein [Geothrix sp.]